LSTVSIQPEKIGVVAAGRLLEKIDYPRSNPKRLILPPRLVIRDSG